MTEWTPERIEKARVFWADTINNVRTKGPHQPIRDRLFDALSIITQALDALESQQRELETARKAVDNANRLSGALGEVWRRDAALVESLCRYYTARAGEGGSDD